MLRLRTSADNKTRCIGGESVSQSCELVKNLTGRMVGILQELHVDYVELVKPRLTPAELQDALETELIGHVALYENLFSTLSQTLTTIHSTSPPIVLEGKSFLGVVKLR